MWIELSLWHADQGALNYGSRSRRNVENRGSDGKLSLSLEIKKRNRKASVQRAASAFVSGSVVARVARAWARHSETALETPVSDQTLLTRESCHSSRLDASLN